METETLDMILDALFDRYYDGNRSRMKEVEQAQKELAKLKDYTRELFDTLATARGCMDIERMLERQRGQSSAEAWNVVIDECDAVLQKGKEYYE